MAKTLQLLPLAPTERLQAVSGAAYVLTRRAVARTVSRGEWPPLNGQRLRTATVDGLIAAYRPDMIVETGTYMGSTTRFFSSFGVPVYSVEISAQNFYAARLRLRRTTNVTLALGSSPALLSWLLAQPDPAHRPLFYLDAHWGDYLPLRRELELIWTGWPTALVIVDDFEVPHDRGFGYDDYGPVGTINLELCDPPPSVRVCWPAEPAAAESGHRRGTSYMGQGPDAHAALAEAVTAGGLICNSAPTVQQPAH